LTQYPFSIPLTTIYSWTFNITTGYNNLVLSQPVQVSKGYFIQLIQVTGQVSIDTTGTASYSDLAWNDPTQWTRLSAISIVRFYLTATLNFTSYQTAINVFHSYASIGLYTLSLTFASSNKTFQQIINITDCKFSFLFIFYIIFFILQI
jgi:hypothetical protein